MKKIEGIPEPLNTDERYYHAMVVRLDALCHMVSSLVEHIAKQENIAVTENKIEEKVVEVKEEVKEAPKRPARKRKS